MNSPYRACVCVTLTALLFCMRLLPIQAAEPATSPADVEFFEKRIRPVLIAKCYACHSETGKQSEGGLRVDGRAAMRQGGGSGPAVLPGKPSESLLLAAIRHDGLEMPPGEQLPAEVIRDFEEWIRRGAPDPRTEAAPPTRTIDLTKAREWWSLRRPTLSALPTVRETAWPRGDIDHFVLAKLEAAGLQPLPLAERATLLRRVTFDLTGLPPTPAELDAFLQDSTPDAFAVVVDRLLASPRFGERWGRYWLDVARYAESAGKAMNVVFPHAWRYRDYVVHALNTDKPYDRFLQEQLAGDLLPAASPAERDAQLVATGFLALGAKGWEEGSGLEKFQLEQADDQIDVVTRGLLGLTVTCARCHDHKFDPISLRDYYGLAGIFLSSETRYGPGPQHTGYKVYGTPLTPLGADGAALHVPYEAHAAQIRETQAQLGKARSDRYGRARKRDSLTSEQQQITAHAPTSPRLMELPGLIAAEAASISEWDLKIKALQQAVTELEAARPPAPAYAMTIAEAAPTDCALRVRGEWNRRGPAVPRGVPEVLRLAAVDVPAGASGRLELAHWITHPDHPLTARVAVNRVWQQLFGAGLVRTPDNFGVTGERPSHPELLDHLAVTFQQEGWSVKRLIRRIVLSRTYQLAAKPTHHAPGGLAAADPENRLLGRHSLRRLDAEELRDTLLLVSGQLQLEAAEGSRILAGKVTDNRVLEALPIDEADRPVRTLYLVNAREVPVAMLPAFDAADPNWIVTRRDRRTIPAQSLFLLNSRFVVQQADAFTDRLLQTHDTDEARLHAAFRTCFARVPTATELAATQQYLRQTAPPGNWKSLCQALFATAEFRVLE